MNVGVVDYDAGNLKSVETALSYLGHDYKTSGSPEDLDGVEVLVVPGVGEAATAMKTLEDRGLDALIKSHAAAGKRLIGICLGLQLFVESSEERNAVCLSLLPGRILRFSPDSRDKVPHMGWNQLHQHQEPTNPVFDGIPDARSFYFVHSYYLDPSSAPDSIGTTNYSRNFVSAIARDNTVAFQFHPEKSGPYGLRLLNNAVAGAIC